MFILKQLRRKKKCSQTDLANAIGVSLRTVQLYEKKDANIPIKNLTKIAAYFELTIAELYSYEVNEEGIIYEDPKDLQLTTHNVQTIEGGRFKLSVPLISDEKTKQFVEDPDSISFLRALTWVDFIVTSYDGEDYRAFDIATNAMSDNSIFSIPNRAIVLGRSLKLEILVQCLKQGKRVFCIIVYRKQILCKEVLGFDEASNNIRCHSLNNSPEYADFDIHISEIDVMFEIVKKQF